MGRILKCRGVNSENKAWEGILYCDYIGGLYGDTIANGSHLYALLHPKL